LSENYLNFRKTAFMPKKKKWNTCGLLDIAVEWSWFVKDVKKY